MRLSILNILESEFYFLTFSIRSLNMLYFYKWGKNKSPNCFLDDYLQLHYCMIELQCDYVFPKGSVVKNTVKKGLQTLVLEWWAL